jgi:hypothetical protein
MRRILDRKRLHNWEAVCGVACFIAGITGPVLGLLLLAIEWLESTVFHPLLHVAGTVLLVGGIPLILFAGFCLDWAEHQQDEMTRDSKETQRGAASLAAMAITGALLGTGLLISGALHEQQSILRVATTEVLKRSSKTLGG